MIGFLEQQSKQPKIWISEICFFSLEVLISKVDMKWDGVILPALINMKLT